MVKFIMGGANFDISKAVCDEIIKLFESNSPNNVFYIVPDQFMFETEKEVALRLKEKNLLSYQHRIKFVTIASLAKQILDSYEITKPIANDVVKNIVMHKAIKENENNDLYLLGSILKKPGFCQKMVGTVSMFKTSGISSEDLTEDSIRELLGSDKNVTLNNYSSVAKKLCDVMKIYRTYENYLSGYIDSLDYTARAGDLISRDDFELFDGVDVFVNYFNDFTASQLAFLKKIICKAGNTTFGYSCDRNDPREEVFYTIRSQIDNLAEEAKLNDIEVCYVTDGFSDRMENNSALREISQKIFGYTPIEEMSDGVYEVVCAPNIDEELDFVAAKIKQLCCEKGYLYRDIAVLCTDDQIYSKHVDTAFEKYDIPFFKDIPESILYRPIVSLILALLNVLRDFSVSNLLIYLKTGFIRKKTDKNNKGAIISDSDIDNFESYIFEWNLKTSRLKKDIPFEYSCKNRPDGSPSAKEAVAENIRQCAVIPVLELQKKLKTADGAKTTKHIFDFINEELDVKKELYQRSQGTDEEYVDTQIVRSDRMTWDSLIDIFDTLYKELKGVNISLDDYYQLFYDICANTNLAMPPQYLDSVLVGSIDRTRSHNVKAAFIVGADYNRFPTPAFDSGIFSQFETKVIRENIEYIPGIRGKEYCLRSEKELYCLSLYRAYKAVSLPSDYLCLSYFEQESSNTQNQPSEAIKSVLRLSGNAKIIRTSDLDNEFFCRSIKAAKLRYAEQFYSDNKKKAVLKSALKQVKCSEYVDKLDNIAALSIGNDKSSIIHNINPRVAEIILPRSYGATAIEVLDDCKFSFFCKYLLGVDTPGQRVFNPLNRGNLMHYILQMVLNRYSGNLNEFVKLNRQQLAALSQKYLFEFIERETNGDFSEEKRMLYLFNNIVNSAVDVLITLQSEFSFSNYRPKFFELKLEPDNTQPIINDCDVNVEPPKTQLYSDNTLIIDKIPDVEKATPSGILLNAFPLRLNLDNNQSISIGGKIDRVDMLKGSDNNLYFRIIDYKSSNKKFNTDFAKNGINIQMLLYLFALSDANKGINLNPAGIGYLPSKASGAKDTISEPLSLLASAHKTSGLIIKNEATTDEMYRYVNKLYDKIVDECGTEFAQPDKEQFISEFTLSGSNNPDREEFNSLREDCLNTVRNNLNDVFGGDFIASPFYKTGETAKLNCDYCIYKSVCGNKGQKDTFRYSDKKKGAE